VVGGLLALAVEALCFGCWRTWRDFGGHVLWEVTLFCLGLGLDLSGFGLDQGRCEVLVDSSV